MSSDGVTPSDADVPEGVWATVSPRFVVRPDWRTAGNPGRWPAGVAVLFAFGLGGSLALLVVAWVASKTGYVNTLGTDLEELTLVEQLFTVVLLAPIVEELIFRLPLAARPRWGALAAACAVGALYFAGGGGPVAAIAALFALVTAAAAVLWFQSLVVRTLRRTARSESARLKMRLKARSSKTKFVVRKTRRAGGDTPEWRDGVADWWAAHPRWPVWWSAAAFGLVHLSNYDVAWTVVTVAVAPLVVSPQIWLGLMFTIARVRYGWWAGVGLHAFHNLAVWSVSIALG